MFRVYTFFRCSLPLVTLLLVILSTVNGLPTLHSRDGSLDTNPAEIVSIHNQYRAAQSAPPLVWDAGLASFATQWASACVIQHSGGPYGENIAEGTIENWEQAITAWYNEVELYNFSQPGFSEATGHFTQLVWKATHLVGCGAVYCDNLDGAMYVCEYSPQGNVISSTSDASKYFRQNVL